MVGIAFTGSGKTMVFTLPLIMRPRAEARCRFRAERVRSVRSFHPFENSTQTFRVAQHFCNFLARSKAPEIRPCLCIGGVRGFRARSARTIMPSNITVILLVTRHCTLRIMMNIFVLLTNIIECYEIRTRAFALETGTSEGTDECRAKGVHAIIATRSIERSSEQTKIQLGCVFCF